MILHVDMGISVMALEMSSRILGLEKLTGIDWLPDKLLPLTFLELTAKAMLARELPLFASQLSVF